VKAMILAAGRGERMRPLTDTTPKPLIQAGKHRLIEYHLMNLKKAGFSEVVINIAWLGKQIIDALGNGSHYGLSIQYSDEGKQALETGGGIFNALPLLGDDSFVVINGDIWTDYPLSHLINLQPAGTAHLVLINNPLHNPDGDFYLYKEKLVGTGEKKFTYSGIGVYTKTFFKNQTNNTFPLAPIIREDIKQGLISAEFYNGTWYDIGTTERLQQLIKKQAL
jgi:N-acetyl-alpha-D-muramate 1-phosphate uridylyltransferase